MVRNVGNAHHLISTIVGELGGGTPSPAQPRKDFRVRQIAAAEDLEALRETHRRRRTGGHGIAQANLARLFFAGEGVPKDYVRSNAGFDRAAAQGVRNSVKNRNIISAVTPAQLAEAEPRALREVTGGCSERWRGPMRKSNDGITASRQTRPKSVRLPRAAASGPRASAPALCRSSVGRHE